MKKPKNKFELAKLELRKSCEYSKKDSCENLFCKLHENEYLGSHHEKSHVCIACNFDESLGKVYKFLKQNRSKEDVEYSFTVYILLLYLLTEKLTTIFKHIGITQEYVENKWGVLVEIRRWANFIKHPKGFLFSHHPAFLIDGEVLPIEYKNYKRIDYENFVKKLYNKEDEQKYKETLNQVGNKANILVVVPDPHKLAKDLNKVCREFCMKIRKNEHFKEILKNHAVIDDYSVFI